MKFVHVADKPQSTTPDFNPAIVNQNGLCLYSLIDGFRQVDFNTHTLDDVLDAINEYKVLYVDPVSGVIYFDSGGYSIIVGEVHPSAIYRLIQCYNFVLERLPESYDRIFSIDIPWSKTFSFMNTKEAIYNFNYYSLKTAKEILTGNEEVRKKYFFVWHMKMQAQYEIWSHLYEELELNKIIKCRAIGGLVGLRGVTRIKFSPFIGIAYRCLLDYIEAEDYSTEFTIHYLGCYLPQDRFVMVILDELFKRYLDYDLGICSTYDSINYSHSARLKKDLPLFHFNGNDLESYSNLTEAPTWMLKNVYNNSSDYDFILNEIALRKQGERLEKVSSFAPLNVYSNRQLDLHFEHIIKSYGIADIFFKHSSLTAINRELSEIMDKVKRSVPVVYKKNFVENILKSAEKIYHFHKWFINHRNHKSLDNLMRMFINDIKFPEDLK